MGSDEARGGELGRGMAEMSLSESTWSVESAK